MNILIRGAHLPNDPYSARTDVAVADGVISAVGTIPEDFRPDETIDASRRALLPGLVNAHTHVYMSLFRNYADDLPLHTWLFDHVMPIEDTLVDGETYWGDMLNFAEMIRTGTTCFIDMQMYMRSVVDAVRDSGIRAVLSRAIVGKDRFDEGAVSRYAEAMDAIRYAKETGCENASFMLSGHAIYTCGEDLLRFLAEKSEETGLPVNIHLTESRKEFDDCMAEHGMTPVQYLDAVGLLDRHVVLGHCVYLADGDFALLARPNVHVVTNPASNAKLANGFAPVVRMLKEGVQVALGTDGPSSDNTQNMFSAMHLLSLMQKGAEKDATAMPAGKVLEIATEGGYKAAGLADRIGKIAPGMTADLILIDETAPNMLPQYNLPSALVYSAYGTEVTDSIIGGKIVMRNRELLTIDEERVAYEVGKIAGGSKFRK